MKDTLCFFLLGVALTLAIMSCFMLLTGAYAEDWEETVYVLCNPESYVNIREKPSKRSARAGFAYCGDDFRTDGKIRHGFLHVFAGTENGDGWISTGFIVYSQPEKVDDTWVIDSNGRVAARSTICGKRNRWLKNGKEITVYYVAEVAVTNYGFVDARYVSPVGIEP